MAKNKKQSYHKRRGRPFLRSTVKYNNGTFEAGAVDDKIRKAFKGKIPYCDEIYLRITGKSENPLELLVLTADEACALALILTEACWHVMPHTDRRV